MCLFARLYGAGKAVLSVGCGVCWSGLAVATAPPVRSLVLVRTLSSPEARFQHVPSALPPGTSVAIQVQDPGHSLEAPAVQRMPCPPVPRTDHQEQQSALGPLCGLYLVLHMRCARSPPHVSSCVSPRGRGTGRLGHAKWRACSCTASPLTHVPPAYSERHWLPLQPRGLVSPFAEERERLNPGIPHSTKTGVTTQ